MSNYSAPRHIHSESGFGPFPLAKLWQNAGKTQGGRGAPAQKPVTLDHHV